MRVIFKFSLMLSLITILSACAIKPRDISGDEQVARQSLESLQTWSLSGKIAIITQDERKSAYLSWQQNNQDLNLVLSTIVGSTIAKLQTQDGLATLQADGQSWSDRSASDLIFQVTSWQLPVEGLSAWLKGQAKRSQVIERFDNELLKRVFVQCQGCAPWAIEYKRYGEFVINGNTYSLPTSIHLEQQTPLPVSIDAKGEDTSSSINTRIVLRIDQWREYVRP